ncbi:Kinesin-like protein KIF14, partial [Trichinella papuae]
LSTESTEKSFSPIKRILMEKSHRFFPPLSTPDLPKKFFSNPFSEGREKVINASKNGKPAESLSSYEKALTKNAEFIDDSCSLSIIDEVGSLQNNNGSIEDNLENRSKICVAIRVRPVLETDPDKMPYCSRVVHVNQKLSSIRIMKGKVGQEFKFSHCFDSNSQQEDIFNELSEPLITQLLRGINCTLMAYGQTGSGKTYSMMGSSSKPGIIPRICEKLKIRLCENEPKISSKLKISYYEIYNEKIYDLLADGDKACSLKVREDPKTGAFVDGLRAIEVDKNADILHLIAVGNKRRMMAATRNNNHSSRSHVILSLKLVQNDSSDKILYSSLNLVDLAGSESGATSERLDETSSINKSLHCLGRVIQQLRDGSAHISYRDSVLTRLLKESLGGNALTTLLATITPLHAHIEQTLNTLRYANFAREVINYVQINEASTVNEKQLVTAMLQSKLEYEHKIKELYMLLRMYKNNAIGQLNCDFESVSDTTAISEKTLTGDSITSLNTLTADSELDVEVLDSPYLLWLSSESDLNFSAISLPLKLGSNKIGCDSTADIVVEGTMLSGVECTVFRSVEDVIHVVPENGKELYVNGKQVTTLTMLNYGDRLCLAGEHFLKLCSMNTVPKLNPGELQDAKLEFLMSQNQRLILQLANAAAPDHVREEIKETDINNTPSKANFATQTDSVENFQMVNKPFKFNFSHLLNHNLNALLDLELFVREANYLCKCWNVPYSYTVQCDPGYESEIPTLTVVMHNDIMKTDVDLSADYFNENWLILRSLQQSKKRNKFNDQIAKMFYQAKSDESAQQQHQMPDPHTQSQSETVMWEQSSENGTSESASILSEPSEQNKIVSSETWDSFAERNSKNCTNSKTILDWFLLSARNFHGLLVNLLKNNENEGCYLSKRKKGQLLVGFQNLHIYGQVMAEMPNSFPESAFLIGQLDKAMNNCFAALLTFIQVIKNDEFVTNDKVNSVIRMLLKVFETVGCLCFVLPTVGASHTFKGDCSNCKLSESLYGALFKGLYNGFKKMAAVVGNMIDSENSHIQKGQRETLRRMCLFNAIEKLRRVLKECKRNSECTNHAICNSTFRIIRPMMHSVSSAAGFSDPAFRAEAVFNLEQLTVDLESIISESMKQTCWNVELFSCGDRLTLDDVSSFMIVFYEESIEGLFLDCIGVLIPSRNSTTHTDIAITSRYCLQSENFENANVMTYESFNQGYGTGTMNKISKIYMPNKNSTNRKKIQAEPNIAVIKLQMPIAFTNKVQPICLPEVNEVITDEHRCFFYRFGRIGNTVSYFVPLGMKLLSHEYCKSMIGSTRLDNSTQLCCEERSFAQILHAEYMYNMIPEGSSLICRKEGLFYLLGIQDWIRFPKPNDYARPIVIFTAVSAFTDSSNCGRRGLPGDVLAYTVVFFGETGGRIFVDCIATLVPTLNSSFSDTVVTSRYCVLFNFLENTKVAPAYLFNQNNYIETSNGVRRILFLNSAGTNRSRRQPPPNISIIKMRLPILINFDIQPVCLPEEYDYPTNEQQCIYYRFFYVGGATLLFTPISMKQITDEHCKSIIGNSRKDSVSQMCFEEKGPVALFNEEFVESLFCGYGNNIDDIGSYTVIFYGETSEGFFIDCTGMLIPSQNFNETHTDTVITTRYCLQSENHNNINVLPMTLFQQMGPHGNNKILRVYFPNKKGTGRSKRQPQPNIAIVKLRNSYPISSNSLPICLPEQNEVLSPSNNSCIFYRFGWFDGVVAFLPLKMNILSHKQCKSTIGNVEIDSSSQICCEEQSNDTRLDTDYHKDMIPDGFPLICLKNETAYLYGVQDWLWTKKAGENYKPVVLFTAVSAFINNHLSSYYFQNSLAFCGLEYDIGSNCVGSIVPSNANYSHSDIIITSRNCINPNEVNSTIVLPFLSYNHDNYTDGYKIHRVIFLTHNSSSGRVRKQNIALVKLQSAIAFSPSVSPLCLPNEGDFLTEDSECSFFEIHQVTSDIILFSFSMKILSIAECNNFLERYPYQGNEKICAKEAYESAQGLSLVTEAYMVDEGTPLICTVENTHYLFGIKDWMKIFKPDKHLPPLIVAAECGRSHGAVNVGSYITVFYTSTTDGFFVDCVGMIVSSNNSASSSKFVLTSRYCLEPEEPCKTNVLPLNYFKYQYFLEGAEIENVWFPKTEAVIKRGLNLAPKNFAVVKLNADLYFNSKVSPICLPDQNEKPQVSSLCYYYQFYNGTDISYVPIRMSVLSDVLCQSVIGIRLFDPKTQICCEETQNQWNLQAVSVECGSEFYLEDSRYFMVVFYGRTNEGVFFDCIGAIVESGINSTHSDLIITSKYCVNLEDIKKTFVIPVGLYPPNDATESYKIHRILLPLKNDRKSHKNLAVVKLLTPIEFDYLTLPICLPERNETFDYSYDCYYFEFYAFPNEMYVTSIEMFVLQKEYCNSIVGQTVLFDNTQLCAVQKSLSNTVDNEDPTLIEEGLPFICIKNHRQYLYAIRDWIKVFKPEKNLLPIVILTETSNIVDLIQHANVLHGNITYLHGADIMNVISELCGQRDPLKDAPSYMAVFYGTTEEGLFKDCVGAFISVEHNATSSDLVITTKYCMQQENNLLTKVLPMNYFNEYYFAYGLSISRILFPPSSAQDKNKTSPNIAIVELESRVHFDGKVAPLCLPQLNEPYPENSTCHYFKFFIEKDFLISFISIRTSLCPMELCTGLVGNLVVHPNTQICCNEYYHSPSYESLIEKADNATAIPDGSLLICQKNMQYYLYGIQDWIKIFKKESGFRPEATFMCGQTAENDDGMPHYVVFYAVTEEGKFHDCMGVIADSDSNFTHSDTIITSRYCLAEADISATKVLPLPKYLAENFSDGYKISKILIHEKSNTNSNSKSYIPNIAIIKLNQPISYEENISPMCFPNKSDTLNESSACEIAEIYIGAAIANLFTWSDEDVLTEGSALVCNIQGRRYLYGVRDFVKEFIKEPYKLPVVVVTFIPPLVDFIKENM